MCAAGMLGDATPVRPARGASDWPCVLTMIHTENGIGFDGATVLAPELGKLVKMAVLSLRGTCRGV